MGRTWKVLCSLWQTLTMGAISSRKDSAVTARKSTSLHLSADCSLCYLGGPEQARPIAASGISRWWGREIRALMIRAEKNPRCSCLQELFDFFNTRRHCRSLLSKKQASFCGLFVGTVVSKNISSSHTETANPQEKRYWILVMHTTSLHYQSKQWNASGQILYFDNRSHEKLGSFFWLQCVSCLFQCFLKAHRSPFSFFMYFFFSSADTCYGMCSLQLTHQTEMWSFSFCFSKIQVSSQSKFNLMNCRWRKRGLRTYFIC